MHYTDGVPTFTLDSRREPNNSVTLFCVSFLWGVSTLERVEDHYFSNLHLCGSGPRSSSSGDTHSATLLCHKLRALLRLRVRGGRRRDRDPTPVPYKELVGPISVVSTTSRSETGPWVQTVPERVRTPSTPSIIGRGRFRRSNSGSTWRDLRGVGVLIQGTFSLSIYQGKRERGVWSLFDTRKEATGSGPRPKTRR